jgi:hypothetical protein
MPCVSSRLILSWTILSFFACSKQHIIGTRRWYRSIDLLSAWVICSSYHDPESCWIDVSDLIRFVNKGFALILAQTKCLHSLMDSSIQSHCVWESHVPVRSSSLNFHRVVPNQVLKTMGIMCRVHKTFEAFDDSDWDLAQFVEPRVFPRCDQFLVPWPRNIKPKLAWPDIRRPWSSSAVWVPSPSGFLGLPQIMPS